MYSSLLLAFAVVTLAISLIYFYVFTLKQERFMQFWGFAWVAYSLSLLFLLLYLAQAKPLFLEIRKLIDMFNILLLLFGVYAFIHRRIPNYWYRFSLYLLLLSGICMIYKFDLLSFYLPISIYQTAITAVICYHIIKYWDLPRIETVIAMLAFGMWGVGKPLLSIYELFSDSTYHIYITELILSNILNFCILTVYAQSAARTEKLKNQLYENVVENAKDVIFYYKLKPYRCFEYVSPSVRELTGYSQNKFYADPRQFVNLVTPEYIDEIEDVLSGDLSYDKGHIFRILRRGGDTFWGEINTSVIPDEHGDPLAIECILRDITELKSVQLEQIRAKKDRDLLLSYISHELRTPVTSIAGYLTALNDGIIKGTEEIQEAMEIVTSKTMTLKSLIDDLDQLSKLESNHFSFDFMMYNASEFAENLVSDIMPDIKMSGAEGNIIGLEDIPKDLNLIADIDRTEQVLGNLVSNAVKYSPEDTGITIVFSIDEKERMFKVDVTDRGPGIADDEMTHIFERFYRGHDPAKTEKSGRGLGLTLSMEIIKNHKGLLTVQNNSTGGSTFTFTIPLFKEDNDG